MISLVGALSVAGLQDKALAADCSGAAQKVVASTGGELLSALPSNDGNGCVVTVIVPARDGNPPRKITRQVPAS
ncbi:hypothetical protein TM49_18550 [Martelella endophytica]|uniref:Uncharacterized protein n=2 Tax=Martelella endophytica TaxID=1486262 RepID=A0A0D5LWF5_MAREN|nr:hypothetical protein TM49_18550 [Martelella endophytica]